MLCWSLQRQQGGGGGGGVGVVKEKDGGGGVVDVRHGWGQCPVRMIVPAEGWFCGW